MEIANSFVVSTALESITLFERRKRCRAKLIIHQPAWIPGLGIQLDGGPFAAQARSRHVEP